MINASVTITIQYETSTEWLIQIHNLDVKYCRYDCVIVTYA